MFSALGFQSTLPVWGATRQISFSCSPAIFQSTLPVWGATRKLEDARAMAEFQSTLPVWGATLRLAVVLVDDGISIHAPRVGSDQFRLAYVYQCYLISIHAPRVGSDGEMVTELGAEVNFNPRSPCGERRLAVQARPGVSWNFNPRSPCGERPVDSGLIDRNPCISIHAPRVGSDPAQIAEGLVLRDFNPRSPCGERPLGCCTIAAIVQFQSTLPVWGATKAAEQAEIKQTISIHAPRVGSDLSFIQVLRHLNISIHAPRVGSDSRLLLRLRRRKNFNPRSPCGERLLSFIQVLRHLNISIHAPRVGSDSFCLHTNTITQ